jgi:hypothetical protein
MKTREHTYGRHAKRLLVKLRGSFAQQPGPNQLILIHLAQRRIVLILVKEIAQHAELTQVRGQDDDAIRGVSLLAEVLDTPQHHRRLEHVALALFHAGIAPVLELLVRVFLLAVV